MKYVFIILSLVLLAGQARATTYYVANAGSDSCDGTSPNFGISGNCAWKTKAHANKITFNPGDTILFNRGDIWFENSLIPTNSGSISLPITIGAYGVGNNPVFDGSSVVNTVNWSGPNGHGVYTFPFKRGTYNLMEDGIPLKKCSTTTCTDGNYLWHSNMFYYKPTSGTPSNHITALMLFAGISIFNHSNIVIDGIDFRNGYLGIGGFGTNTGLSNIEVKNCNFTNLGSNGISIATKNATSSNISIHDNSFSYVNQSIYLGGNSCEKIIDSTINSNIYNNIIINCGVVKGANNHYDWSSTNNGDIEGIGTQNLVSSNIHNNYIAGVCRGIYSYTCKKSTQIDNEIFNNIINTTRNPFAIGGIIGSNVYGNSVHNNIISNTNSSTYGVILYGTPRSTGTINKFYNNTVNGGKVNLLIIPGGAWNTAYWDIKNNILANSTSCEVVENGLVLNVTYDYNLYYPKGSNVFFVTRNKTLSQWHTIDARDAHSILSDPQFINQLTGDFQLKPTSPAINAGTYLGLTNDILGNSIVGIPDIGAHEFQPRE